MSLTHNADVIVVGGGLVGSAIAFGLMQIGMKVTVLDEGDVAFRASRGNFGLVWVQGKGHGCFQYALWSRRSADLWPDFASELQDGTGIDVEYEKLGGLVFSMSETEHEARAVRLEQMRREVPGGYDFRMIDRPELQQMIPEIGHAVVGASYCPHDGHANPLMLLRALHQTMKGKVDYVPCAAVTSIERTNGVFTAQTGELEAQAPKIVLASGLGNQRLAPMVGLKAPISPLKGQILVTERVKPNTVPLSLTVRQTRDGTVMMGDSFEDVGLQTAASVDVGRAIARRAIAQFPSLSSTRVVRQWAGLRIMSPDGFPLYDQSHDQPGAFVANCHSGVTLAAVHAKSLAAGIAAGRLDPLLESFSGSRFEDKP